MPARKSTTKEQIDEMVKLYTDGHASTYIARRLGVSPAAVRWHLLKRNVTMRSTEHTRALLVKMEIAANHEPSAKRKHPWCRYALR